MTLSQEQIEWIVREVVRRLQAAMARDAAIPNEPTVTTPAASELSLSERLVTLETLRDRLAGVKRLLVAKRAIVTPAAVDLLKDHQVELVRQS